VNQKVETLHTSMLKTLTLLLTLCVSGGDTSSEFKDIFPVKCPYNSVTQCPQLNNKCCKCVDDYEVECKEWDDDNEYNAGPISVLPPFTGRGGWPQYKFTITSDIETLPMNKVPPKMQTFICWCSKLEIVSQHFFLGSQETMEYVYISGSPMDSLSSFKALSMLTALTSLRMVGSGLTDARFTSLPFANTLTELNLDGNLLTSIPDTTMLTSLEHLNLNNNEISGELSHTFPSSLESLELGYNKITKISSLSFTGGKSLSFTFLLLTDNAITAVSSNAFDQIPELEYLYTDGHHLTRLPLALAKLTKLKDFDISPAVNDKDEPIKDFQCTCDEAESLVPWYAALVEEHPDDLEFSGECKYGSTTISVEQFLKEEGPKCPKKEVNGDGKGEVKGDGEGEVKGDGEGEVKGDGKGEVKGDGEGEVKGDGEGEVKGDGEGEVKGDGKGVGSAGYPIYSSPVLSFFCLFICLLVYVF